MSDRRGPSWVDYGNLAANVVQVGQLSNVQARLKELAQIEAAREERTRLENQLKQFVFDLEEATTELPKYGKTAPLGVVFAARLATEILNNAGVQPSTFQEFVDKDRVRAFRQRIAALAEQGLALLKTTEVEEIDRMLPFVTHFGDLNLLIAALEAREQLDNTEAEHKRFQEKVGNGTTMILVGAGLAVLGSMLLCVGESSGEGGSIGLILGLIGLAVGVFGASRRNSAFTAEYRALEEKRRSWQAKLLSNEKHQALIQIFGEGLPIEDYRKKGEEIAAFLTKSLKHDKDGNPLPKSLLWELPPPPSS